LRNSLLGGTAATRRYRDLLLGVLTALPCLATAGLSAMQAPEPVPQRHGVLAEPLVAFDAPTSAECQALAEPMPPGVSRPASRRCRAT